MREKRNRNEHKKSPVAAVCSILGTVLLVIVILGCIPLTVPRVFGYQMYTVISGSMEPAIPTGSLVYIKNVPPEEIQVDDVIAFYEKLDTTSIITHRVVKNNINMGQFTTKGDANKEKDMNPIKYDEYHGKVVLTIPVVGGIAQTLTTGAGRILIVSMIILAVLLEIVSSCIARSRASR